MTGLTGLSLTSPLAARMSSAGGTTEMVVKVSGVDIQTGKVMVVDSFGNEFEIDGTLRAKGVGFPKEEESWLIVKKGVQWVLSIQLGAPAIAVITGDRMGLHPIVGQILDALAEQGLVADDTTYTPDPTDIPDDFTVDPTEDGIDETDEIPPEENEGSIDPDYNGPDPEPVPTPTPTTHPPATSTPVTPPKDPPYLNRWVPLYAGTFNTYKTLGPATAEADIRRLTSTKMQIIGLQEAHGEERNGLFSRLADHGWSVYRPKIGAFSDENTIIYRDSEFTRLGQGVQLTSTEDVSGMPPRYLNWVKLLHKDSNRVVYFMSTHLDPKLDNPNGSPNFGGRPWVHEAVAQIANIADQMKVFNAKAPVITAGDFNLNALHDAAFRYPGFPAAKFAKAANARSNWATLGRPHGGRWISIDHIYLSSGKKWNVRMVDSWGFNGYRSDHHPGMVKFSIRAKSKS